MVEITDDATQFDLVTVKYTLMNVKLSLTADCENTLTFSSKIEPIQVTPGAPRAGTRQ